jgi:hypothetical protein
MTTATENLNRKLTKLELTKAYTRYARSHGFYVRTVRDVTDLKYRAIREFRSKLGLNVL